MRGERCRLISLVLPVLVMPLLVGLAGSATAAASQNDDGDRLVPYSILAGAAATLVDPGGAPPGANDFSCEPTEEHPHPVVLVHGLGANMAANWRTMSPLLANHGYCVFALTYGEHPAAPPGLDQVGGLLPMQRSAHQLARFIARVRAATGAEQVDIVGHSEGSLMPNYYVKFLDGADEVDDYVALTPLWDGTTLGGFFFLEAVSRTFGLTPVEHATIDRLCGSCRQFLAGSDFLRTLNSGGGPAVAGVDYTNILTIYDELVVPYTSGLMDAPNATNVVVQDLCPTDFAEHGELAFDPVAAQVVLNALDPDSARPPPCHLVTPVGAVPDP